ncbi:hypothetical protein [Streptomyces cinereoruber]
MTALTEALHGVRPLCTRRGLPQLGERLAATVHARMLIAPTARRPPII